MIRRLRVVFILCSLVSISLPTPLQAVVPDFYSDSNIQFYDPNACDPNGSATSTGDTASTTGSVEELATQMLANNNISYWTNNGVNTRDVVVALSRGEKAHTTAANAPNREVDINPNILKFILEAATKGKVMVNALTDKTHSNGSNHYSGEAVDLDNSPSNTTVSLGELNSIAEKYGGTKNSEASHYHYDFPKGASGANSGGSGASTPPSSGICCPNPSLGGVSGSVSSRVGYGASEKGKKSLQEAVVAAGAAHGMDPNFVASFYYAENSRTGDSTNNADASKGTPVTGDGKWRDPAPPEGEGGAWDPPNAWTAYGPFQFVTTTWQTYKPPGSNDTTDRLDLRKEAWAASKYMKVAGNGRGVTTSTSDGELRRKVFAYNHDDTYVSSVINTYKYLSGRSSTAVSSSSGCASDTDGTTGTIVGDLAWPVPVKYTRSNWDWFTKPHHDYPSSDIPVPDKTSVYSITDGKVTYAANGAVGAGSNGGFGTVIAIESGGALFRYQHGTSDTLKFKVGDTVKKGDLIMKSGYTGHVVPASSAGSHLHVSIETGDSNPVKRPTNHCPQELFKEMKSGGNIKKFKDLPTSGCVSGAIY